MKKRIVSLLMVATLVFGASTTVFAAPSPVVNASPVVDNSKAEASVLAPEKVTEVKNLLADTNATTEEKITELASMNVETKESFATSIKEDASLLKALEELEATVNVEKFVENNSAAVKGDVKVVGMGLNAEEGETAVLNMVDNTKAPVAVPNKYANAVQININLFVEGNKVEDLDVPIAITMEAPTGVTLDESLVILHHHDGEVTKIKPAIGADGRITFAVAGFSTFVFANEVPADASYLYYIMANPYGTASTDTANVVTAPKTGEAVNVAAVMAVMAMAVGVVVIVRRKVTVK